MIISTLRAAFVLSLILMSACVRPHGERLPVEDDWMTLFNGSDLEGWTVKINGHDTGVNFADTFRAEDGLIKVRYDGYGDFDEQFGHLYYQQPFSHYRLRLEYRFVGELHPGAPGYTLRNSGVMLHSQDPHTMLRGQNWPISVEMQFLGGLGDGRPRPTGNMCSPGTDVVFEGSIDPRHCIDSTSDTYDGDQWVHAEAIVLGDSLITHLINGDTVLQYSQPQMGGGVVEGFDPAVWEEGKRLDRGSIALQSEGQPIDFRNLEILNLVGCMDPASSRYRSYFVKSDPEACSD